MACQSGPSTSEYLFDARKELDKVSRLLCDVMTQIDDIDRRYPENVTISKELKDWWTEHKILDQKRLEREKKRAEEIVEFHAREKNLKKIAKNMSGELTPDEIAAIKKHL